MIMEKIADTPAVSATTSMIIAVLAAALTGCAAQSGSLGTAPPAPSESTPAAASPGPGGSATPTPGAPGAAEPGAPGSADGAAPPAGAAGTMSVQVWLTRSGALWPSQRTVPRTAATSRAALDALAAGPNGAERSAGVGSAVPAGTRLGVTIAGGQATVTGPAGFAGDRLRQAQVVYTLTQYPTVSRVRFAGASGSVGRGDFADLLRPVVAYRPVIGQRVTNPVTVSGTANVFEATVTVRVLDAAGREVGTAFTTATCGSGCRGTYAIAVRYRVAGPQAGTVEAYALSAEDGSPQHVVRVPVTLAG